MEMEEIIKSLRSEFSNELATQLAAQRKDFETKLGEQKKIQNDLVKGLEDKLGEQKAKLAQQNKAHNVQMAALKKAPDDQMAALNALIATDQTIYPTDSRTERVLSWLIAAVLVHITQADKIKKPLGIKTVEWTPVVVGLVALIYYAVGSFVYFVRQLYLKKLAFTLKTRTVTAPLNPSTQSQNLPTTPIGPAHRHQSAAGGAAGLHSSPISQSPNLATGGKPAYEVLHQSLPLRQTIRNGKGKRDDNSGRRKFR